MLSRIENILQSIVDSSEYDGPVQSRIEQLLLDIKSVISAGGSGGVTEATVSTMITTAINSLIDSAPDEYNTLGKIAAHLLLTDEQIRTITEQVNDRYTKEETNELVSKIPKFTIEVVTSLPTENISTTTVYLKTGSKSDPDNIYDEYIYVNSKWELLGTQTVGDIAGLSQRMTTAEANIEQNTSSISTINANVAKKQDKLTAGTNITISGNTISAKDTTYSDATQSAHGLMTAEDKKKLDDLAHAESISSLVFKNGSSETYMGVKFSTNRVSARFLIMENNGRRADIYVSIRIDIDAKAIVYASWNTDTEFRIFYDDEDSIYVVFNCSAWSRGSCISTIENAIMTQWNGTSYPSNLTAIATEIRYTLDSVNFTRYAADKNHTHQYVPWITMGGSGTKALYGIFASLSDMNPTSNQGATLLITDAGNFVSGQTGAWLVQISNRNSKPWMTITTLIPHAAGDVQFGYYHDTANKLFYFGVYTTPYRSSIFVATLRNDAAIIKNFTSYGSEPSGWTVVNPQYDITKATTLTDSGWVATTRNTSFTATSTVKCRKYGQLVEVRGEVTFSSTYGSPTVCTLPAGYRPAAVVHTCGYTPSGKIFGIKVDTEGVVSFSSDSENTFVNGTTYRVDLTYLLG